MKLQNIDSEEHVWIGNLAMIQALFETLGAFLNPYLTSLVSLTLDPQVYPIPLFQVIIIAFLDSRDSNGSRIDSIHSRRPSKTSADTIIATTPSELLRHAVFHRPQCSVSLFEHRGSHGVCHGSCLDRNSLRTSSFLSFALSRYFFIDGVFL